MITSAPPWKTLDTLTREGGDMFWDAIITALLLYLWSYPTKGGEHER